MMERTGICTSCGAKFGNVPPTLTATKVRCRKCGGVVEIPPLPAAAATSAAAAPVAPAPPVAPPPAAAPASSAGPTAQPLAPKVAAAPVAAPLKAPAAPPPFAAKKTPPPPPRPPQSRPPAAPPKPIKAAVKTAPAPPASKAAPLPGKAAPAAPAAAKAPPEPGSARGQELLAKLKAKKTESEQPAPAAPRRPAPAAAPSGRRGAARQERGSRGQQSREHRERPAKKKSKAPLVLGLGAVVVLGGGGLAFFLTSRPSDPAQGTADQSAQAPAGGATGAAADTATTSAQPPVTSTAPAVPAAEAAPSPAATTTAPEPEPAAAEQQVWTAPEPGQPIPYRGIRDPDLIDFSLVPPLPKWSGATDEEWQQVNEDLALFLEDSGAQSNRAGERLVAAARPAYPAIVNAMLQADFNSKDGIRTVSTLNELLAKIGTGTNYGWKSVDRLEPGTEEWQKAVLFDKQVVAAWHSGWVTKLSNDDKQWEGFVTKGIKKPEEQQAEKATEPPPSSVLQEFDD